MASSLRIRFQIPRETNEVAVPKELFQAILRLIDGLRPRPAPA